MIQGGYNGLRHWLKLDPDYISKHSQGLSNYAEWHDLDYNDPYDLLWTLLGYSNASSKPWLHPKIDDKALNDLALDAQMGNEDSRELLVLFMYRITAEVSRRFSWALEMFPIDRTDLIHEGILGIYNALEKWNINERADFPYWAQQWIYSAIEQMVTLKGPMIKLPYHIRKLQGRLHKIRDELEEEIGIPDRQATYEELAVYIRSKGYDDGIKKMLTGAEIAMLEKFNVTSLNVIINNDESEYTELMDLVPDDEINILSGNSDLIKELEYRDLINALMDKLDDIEQFVTLNYRKGGGKLKGDEVAQELVDKNMTETVYTQASISKIFDRAVVKMKMSLKELGLDEDMVFDK